MVGGVKRSSGGGWVAWERSRRQQSSQRVAAQSSHEVKAGSKSGGRVQQQAELGLAGGARRPAHYTLMPLTRGCFLHAGAGTPHSLHTGAAPDTLGAPHTQAQGLPTNYPMMLLLARWGLPTRRYRNSSPLT